MAVNKVILVNPKTEKEETLIDLTIDNSVTEETVLKGETFYKTDGTIGTGKYELETLEVTENRTYTPDANKGYSEVTVKIPTWNGATESLSAFTVTIVNSGESSGPINVSLDNFEILETIEVGNEANFTVPIRTVIYLEPGEADWTDPRLNRVDQDDNIETSMDGNSATGDLTIWGNGKITIKLYDVGADA